jgi:hypothetical protein
MACTSWGQPESANLNFVVQLLKLRCSMAAPELLTGISLHVNSFALNPVPRLVLRWEIVHY